MLRAGGRVGPQSHGTLPIGWLDIAGKHIERFNEVTVPIHDLHTLSFSSAGPTSTYPSETYAFLSKYSRIASSRAALRTPACLSTATTFSSGAAFSSAKRSISVRSLTPQAR